MSTRTRDKLLAWTGHSNDRDIYAALIGERIKGVFSDFEGSLYFVMESGAAFAVCSIGGGTPAFWVESEETWRRKHARILHEVQQRHAEIAELVELVQP